MVQPLSAFANDRWASSGRKSCCKACDRRRAATYYANVRGPRERADTARRRAETASRDARAATGDVAGPEAR